MDINPEDKTFDTMQCQEAFLQCIENEYNARHQHVPVSKLDRLLSSTLVISATASGSCQSSFDPNDLSCENEEYLRPNNVADTTPGQCYHVAC
jgi:hypothetical protein